MKIIELPLNKIRPDPQQPRKTFNPDKIEELAQTIKTAGVINPIEVDESYMIITGENRWRAAKKAGLTKTWVKVLKIDKDDRFMRQVIENIQYANLTPHEIAVALQKLLNFVPSTKLHQGQNLGISKLANQIGKHESWVREHLSLLDASPALQKAIQKGLPMRALRHMSRLPKEFQAEMERKVLKGDFPNSIFIEQVALAINRNPEKAKEIFAIDYSKYKDSHQLTEQLSKIAPRLSDMVLTGQPPYDQIYTISKQLQEWLDRTTPEMIGAMRLKGVIVTLSTMKSEIDDWMKAKLRLDRNQAKQLKE